MFTSPLSRSWSRYLNIFVVSNVILRLSLSCVLRLRVYSPSSSPAGEKFLKKGRPKPPLPSCASFIGVNFLHLFFNSSAMKSDIWMVYFFASSEASSSSLLLRRYVVDQRQNIVCHIHASNHSPKHSDPVFIKSVMASTILVISHLQIKGDQNKNTRIHSEQHANHWFAQIGHDQTRHRIKTDNQKSCQGGKYSHFSSPLLN